MILTLFHGSNCKGTVFLLVVIVCFELIFSTYYARDCAELHKWEKESELMNRTISEENSNARIQKSELMGIGKNEFY